MELNSQLIHGFAGSMLAKRYDGTTPTPQCHIEWWDLCASKDPLVAIAAPRGHGKSTAITHAYTLSEMLFRHKRFGVIVSDTETQAVNFLNDIKTEAQVGYSAYYYRYYAETPEDKNSLTKKFKLKDKTHKSSQTAKL